MSVVVSEVSLAEACRQLRLTWARGYSRMLEGKLEGRKNANGRWLVTTRSVAKLRKELEADRSAA